MMNARGFHQTDKGVWEQTLNGLTARIVETTGGQLKFEIEKSGEWSLTARRLWDSHKEALDCGARLFGRLTSQLSTVQTEGQADWTEYLKDMTVGEHLTTWLSDTTVLGSVIKLRRTRVLSVDTWDYQVSGEDFMAKREKPYESREEARRQAERIASIIARR